MKLLFEDVQYTDILDYVKSATNNYEKSSGLVVVDTQADMQMAITALKAHYNNVKPVIVNNKYQILYSDDDTLEESKKKNKVGFGGLELIPTPGSEAAIAAFNAGCGEAMGEDLEETYQKHPDLNNDLFEDGELKPEVKEKLQEIADHFINFVKENDVDIKVEDVRIVGSNASYNYTDNSDIDCHIVADIDEANLDKLYDAYRRIWNNTYSPEIFGHEVEIYVEPTGKSAKSNGIYSINSGWVKVPSDEGMPEAIETDITDWLKRADDCVTEEDINKYFDDLYKMRQHGLMTDGEYSVENQTFKDIRDTGVIKTLKNRLININNDKLSLVNEDISNLNMWRD